jgi:hypothetical protein
MVVVPGSTDLAVFQVLNVLFGNTWSKNDKSVPRQSTKNEVHRVVMNTAAVICHNVQACLE